MGIIELKGMEFYSFHGHFQEEQIVGNRFLVDLTIETDMTKAMESDDLEDAVDYQKAYNIIKREMKKKSHLLENIAGRIVKSLKSELSGIQSVTVKVSKMNPPLGGKTAASSVTYKD